MSFRYDESGGYFINDDLGAWSTTGNPGTWKPILKNRITEKKVAAEAMNPILKPVASQQYETLFESLPTEDYDPVHYPRHYTQYTQEVWDILDEAFPTNPHLWQVGKYLLRANLKGDYLENLEKANAYLSRAIMAERRKRGL